MKELLKGRKKYIVLGVAAVIWFAEAIGFAPPGTLADSTPLLVIAGGAAVGDTLNRMAGK